MKAILIFDNVNDLLFSKWDDSFIENLKSLHQNNAEVTENMTEGDNVAQLLSPIVTSQRVMAAQFGNSYSSIQCKDNTTMVFEEWLEHMLMIISKQDVDDAHRELLDCRTLVQHVTGQNIQLLSSPVYQQWVSVLLDARTRGAVEVRGAGGTVGESGAGGAALAALRAAAKPLRAASHLLLYVGDKLLALYSSRGGADLTPADVLLARTQSVAAQHHWGSRGEPGAQLPWLSTENSGIVHLCASAASLPSVPHALYVAELSAGLTLVVLRDCGLREVGVACSVMHQLLSNLNKVLLQRNLELLPSTLDHLEAASKKLCESLRKARAPPSLAGTLAARTLDVRRAALSTAPLTPESAAAALTAALAAVDSMLRPDIPSLQLTQTVETLRSGLAPYADFLRVKAARCFSLGSEHSEGTTYNMRESDGSLTLHKYVSEFPGLIHFVLVDRLAQRYLAPDLTDSHDLLDRDQLESILSRALRIVREGYAGGAWRDTRVHACLVTWWARREHAVRPQRAPRVPAVRALPPPGDMLGTFYRQLTEEAFPSGSDGASLMELVCVHLGVVPAATALQHARTLAHSLPDLVSPSSADLL